MEGSVMTATVAVVNEDWLEHVPLVFSHLDERQRRWVGGLLSELLVCTTVSLDLYGPSGEGTAPTTPPHLAGRLGKDARS